MSTGFTVNLDEIGQAEKTLEDSGHTVNDVRKAVPAEPADAGASTAMLDLVVSYLFVAATALERVLRGDRALLRDDLGCG